MRWALKRRTIRPLIPVCLMAVILVVFTSSIAVTESRTVIKVKDLPSIFSEPEIQYAEPGSSPWGADCLMSVNPYDPNRRDDKEEVVIEQLTAPINYYNWLFNHFPLLKQVVLGF